MKKETVDYLLKPVAGERLTQVVARLKRELVEGSFVPEVTVDWMRKLIAQAASSSGPAYLQWLNVQHGDGVQLIAVDDVIYFQSKDKYTAVVTLQGEALIRKSIRELAVELDPDRFAQIHRGTIVRLRCIDQISRSLTGRGVIRIKG